MRVVQRLKIETVRLRLADRRQIDGIGDGKGEDEIARVVSPAAAHAPDAECPRFASLCSWVGESGTSVAISTMIEPV